MLPNASVAATLPVQNTGTVPFSYAMYAAATSSPLAPYLKVTVSTGTSNGTVCSGARRSRPPSRWCRRDGNLVSTARTVGGGASETLCFQVALDSAAPTAVQGLTLNTSFNFSATTV
ncbi:hypothetical protein GS425_01000 [Rhodococcus hoagii]|nr:hypothetical protein [Prescottella equi]